MKIKVAKVPSKQRQNKRLVYAQVCYHYGYSLREVSKLPARDIKLLLDTAQKIEARRMAELVQIAAAPHTEKGRGVKNLIEHYKGIMNGR